jgi:hypothetical protein
VGSDQSHESSGFFKEAAPSREDPYFNMWGVSMGGMEGKRIGLRFSASASLDISSQGRQSKG